MLVTSRKIYKVV